MPKWSGKTPKNILELELNFSNVCGAECVICSRPHGCGNNFFMDWDIFNELISQLGDVNFEMIQTSGNGEAFLNPNYLDYIAMLKGEFPNTPRWTYNNFSMLNKQRSDWIVEGNLFDKIHVRIDSLHKWIFEQSSNLNQDTVFNNLKYFLSINTKIPVVILYNNIVDYYNKCKKVLGKRPVRDFFTDKELEMVPNEQNEIKDYFQKYSNVPLTVCRIGHSLWGERKYAPLDTKSPCPKFNVISKVTWICPNGGVEACCYSDDQKTFNVGNIMEEHILDIFYGERRKKLLQQIKNREIVTYPCVNPKACFMGTEFGVEEK